MFESEVYIPIDRIGEIHVVADTVGRMFETQYSCKY